MHILTLHTLDILTIFTTDISQTKCFDITIKILLWLPGRDIERGEKQNADNVL